MKIFDISQIKSPAGAATNTALPRTNRVLSNIERIITFPIWGRLYGGNSKINDDGIPFKMVFDKNFEVKNVINTPIMIVPVSSSVDTKDLYGKAITPAKNIDIIAINLGNAPPNLCQQNGPDGCQF